jgi:hypothetical protein
MTQCAPTIIGAVPFPGLQMTATRHQFSARSPMGIYVPVAQNEKQSELPSTYLEAPHKLFTPIRRNDVLDWGESGQWTHRLMMLVKKTCSVYLTFFVWII